MEIQNPNIKKAKTVGALVALFGWIVFMVFTASILTFWIAVVELLVFVAVGGLVQNRMLGEKRKVRNFAIALAVLILVLLVSVVVSGGNQTEPTKPVSFKHDRAYVITTLGVIDGLTPFSFEVVQTWNEEIGVYANIAVPSKTSQADLVALLRVLQEGLKGESGYVDINVFDNLAAATNYFQRIGELNNAGRFTEAEQLFSHYIGTYTRNPVSGFEELKVKEGDNWKKVK